MSSPRNGRRFVRGLSGPHYLRTPSLTRLVRFWYSMHAPKNAGRLPPEVCARCGEPGELVIRYVGSPRRNQKRASSNAIRAVNDGLSDKWTAWCVSCARKADAKKVPSRLRSERALRGYKKSQAKRQPNGADNGAVTASAPSNGSPATLLRTAPTMIRGIKVKEAEQNYRRENGKLVLPPEQEGWNVTLANGERCTVPAPAARG